MLTEGGNRICSPELLSQIAEVIDSAVIITRFGNLGQYDHRIIYANPAFSKLTGYKPNEVVGRSPDILVDQRTSSEKILEFYSRAVKGGKFSLEIDSFQKGSGELKLKMDVTPVIDETQGTHYYILNLKPLPQETANNENVPLNQALTQSFVAEVVKQPAPPVSAPPVAEARMVQPQMQSHEPAPRPQNTMPEFLQQHSNVEPLHREAPQKEFGHFQEQEFNRYDEPVFDERYWLSPNNDLTPHNDALDHVRELVGMTKSHLAKMDVKKPAVSAELSSEESIAEYCKTQFLANMSHDLRTPLNAIIGFSEVIKDQLFGPIENPRYVSYANDIFRSGQELLATISEIMELSEIQPDEDVEDGDRMNICDLIESVVEILSPKAFESDIRIIKSFDARDLKLTGDRRKIKQAIAGVVGNAIKYSAKGSKIEIGASITEKGDFKFSVYAKTANIINTKAAMMGTLTKKMESEYPEISLAKRFIEAHEGKFAIFNSQTAGTEISIILPSSRLSMETEKKTLLKVIS